MGAALEEITRSKSGAEKDKLMESAAVAAVATVARRPERARGGEEDEEESTAAFPRVHEVFRYYPHSREFFCGGTAAAINIVITFPLNKVMFRQQLFGLNTWQALENVRQEGWLMLYRGVKPPLLQAMVSKSIMFGLYNWYDELLADQFGRQQGIHLLAAGLAGTTEAILTPFETLLQTPKYNREITGAYDAMLHMNKFGLREHYRGLSAILLRNGPGNIMFFGLRGPLRDTFPTGTSPAVTMLHDFVCGAMLGALISTVSFPINVARARMQSVYGKPFMTTREALRGTYVERGHSVWRVYRGVHMNFFRSLLSWGIVNSTYEKLKSLT